MFFSRNCRLALVAVAVCGRVASTNALDVRSLSDLLGDESGDVAQMLGRLVDERVERRIQEHAKQRVSPLETENVLLRRELDDLKREVADMAENEHRRRLDASDAAACVTRRDDGVGRENVCVFGADVANVVIGGRTGNSTILRQKIDIGSKRSDTISIVGSATVDGNLNADVVRDNHCLGYRNDVCRFGHNVQGIDIGNSGNNIIRVGMDGDDAILLGMRGSDTIELANARDGADGDRDTVIIGRNCSADSLVINANVNATCPVNIEADVDIKAALDVTGAVAVGGELTAGNDTVIRGDLIAEGDAAVLGSATIGDSCSDSLLTINARVNATCSANFEAAVDVKDDLDVGGDLDVEKKLTAEGDVEIRGDLDVRANVTIAGGATIQGGATIEGGATVGDDLDVEGDANVGLNLKVLGDAHAEKVTDDKCLSYFPAAVGEKGDVCAYGHGSHGVDLGNDGDNTIRVGMDGDDRIVLGMGGSDTIEIAADEDGDEDTVVIGRNCTEDALIVKADLLVDKSTCPFKGGSGTKSPGKGSKNKSQGRGSGPKKTRG